MKRKNILFTMSTALVLMLTVGCGGTASGGGSNSNQESVTTPSENPSVGPSEVPTETPTEVPTETPTETPTEKPFVAPEYISIIGKFLDFNWNYDLDLESLDKGHTWNINNVSFVESNEWKIRQNHLWNGSEGGADWGYDSLDETSKELVSKSDTNIKINQDGIYNISFNYDTSLISLTRVSDVPEIINPYIDGTRIPSEQELDLIQDLGFYQLSNQSIVPLNYQFKYTTIDYGIRDIDGVETEVKRVSIIEALNSLDHQIISCKENKDTLNLETNEVLDSKLTYNSYYFDETLNKYVYPSIKNGTKTYLVNDLTYSDENYQYGKGWLDYSFNIAEEGSVRRVLFNSLRAISYLSKESTNSSMINIIRGKSFGQYYITFDCYVPSDDETTNMILLVDNYIPRSLYRSVTSIAANKVLREERVDFDYNYDFSKFAPLDLTDFTRDDKILNQYSADDATKANTLIDQLLSDNESGVHKYKDRLSYTSYETQSKVVENASEPIQYGRKIVSVTNDFKDNLSLCLSKTYSVDIEKKTSKLESNHYDVFGINEATNESVIDSIIDDSTNHIVEPVGTDLASYVKEKVYGIQENYINPTFNKTFLETQHDILTYLKNELAKEGTQSFYLHSSDNEHHQVNLISADGTLALGVTIHGYQANIIRYVLLDDNDNLLKGTIRIGNSHMSIYHPSIRDTHMM